MSPKTTLVPIDFSGHKLRKGKIVEIEDESENDLWPIPNMVEDGKYIMSVDIVILFLICVILLCLSIDRSPNGRWDTFFVAIASICLLPVAFWIRAYTEKHAWAATTVSLLSLLLFGMILYVVLIFIYDTEININQQVQTTKTTLQNFEDQVTNVFNKVKSVFTKIFSPFIWLWNKL